MCAEWGIKPWEQDQLTARDMQDIMLAEHAETYLEQVKQREQSSSGSVQTKSGLEHRNSKRKRIEEAKKS